MVDRVVIVGAGHAAGQCVASLRQKGWEGEITLIGEEPSAPYQRPPLSKAFLAGEMDQERLLLKPLSFYEQNTVDLRLNTKVTSVDSAAKTVTIDGGEQISYSKLVFATGTRVRTIPLPGCELDGVGYLRTIEDVEKLKQNFKQGAHLAIIGAGYIGLEVAAVAAKHGLKVTVVEREERVLSRVAGTEISNFFQELHKTNGVDIRLAASLDSFKGGDKVETVVLSGGEELPCDLAVIGVGVLPNQELAEEAGVKCDNGIIVDECTRTSDPDIFAIGDCTRHPSKYFGDMLRLESVQNALEQAKSAGSTICGKPLEYNQVPWFWSDQYDVKLQTAGICTDRYDQQIIRGSVEDKRFSVFYLNGEDIVCVDSINSPADHIIARHLLDKGLRFSVEQIQDLEFDLKQAVLKK